MAHMEQNEKGNWFLVDNWHIDDVKNVRPDLDDDQCIHVLEIMADDYDANNGINWDVIRDTAYNLFPIEDEDEDDDDDADA
jgi:hypothetical protein